MADEQWSLVVLKYPKTAIFLYFLLILEPGGVILYLLLSLHETVVNDVEPPAES